jgi:hypothetical protein
MTVQTQGELPRELLKALRDEGGKADALAGRREQAEAWLRRLLVCFAALKEHVAELRRLYDSPFRFPTSRRERRPWLRESPCPATKFPFTDTLKKERIVDVLEGGIEALSDQEKAELLLNPFALYDLHDVILEAAPDAWLPVMNQVGREMRRREGAARPAPAPEAGPRAAGPAADAAPQRGTPRAPQRAPLVMAACLLLSVGVAGVSTYFAVQQGREAAEARRQLDLARKEIDKRDDAVAKAEEKNEIYRLQAAFAKSKVPLHQIWAGSYVEGAPVEENLERLSDSGLKDFIEEARRQGKADQVILNEIQQAAELSKKE